MLDIGTENADRLTKIEHEYKIPYTALFDVVRRLGAQLYWQEFGTKLNKFKVGDASAYLLKHMDFTEATNRVEEYIVKNNDAEILKSLRNPSDKYILSERTKDIGELVTLLHNPEHN